MGYFSTVQPVFDMVGIGLLVLKGISTSLTAIIAVLVASIAACVMACTILCSDSFPPSF